MRQNKLWLGLTGFMMFFMLTGWAWAQSGHGGHGGMAGGMGGMGGMGCMDKGGMGGAGMGHGGNALMHGFHTWTRMLMTHSETLGLTNEQIDKIDTMVTAHLVKAIKDQAEVQAAMVSLQKDLRAKEIDLKSVEKQLQNIHGKKQQMDLEGIRLYTQVLGVLTPEQKEKMHSTISTPFARPWAGGGMNCPMMSTMKGGDDAKGASDKETHH